MTGAARAPRRRRGAIWLGLLFGCVAIVCTALGAWQLQRRVWKLDLIARVEANVAAAPGAAPRPSPGVTIDWPREEYRRLHVSGIFAHDRETLVQAVTVHGPGFWVLTPLATDQGFTLLVNRGFVPSAQRDPANRRDGQVAGPVTVTGLLRLTEPGGAFLRSNDPAGGRWYSRDVAAIAAARGLANTAPYFIDADATPNPGGLPIGGLTVLAFRNPHLVYALTWFTLAALGIGGIVFLLREGRRPGPETDAAQD